MYTANTAAMEQLESRSYFAAGLPRPDHVVIVVEENHSQEAIIGNHSAPYINGLAKKGALFTNSHGITHPSQPNYLALFAGSTLGVDSNDCIPRIDAPNLATALKAKGHTFASFSEGLPAIGSTACSAGAYARKHNPAAVFSNVPKSANRRWKDFPADFNKLPDVSFVIPNQDNDMHDGSVAEGDAWLKRNLAKYAKWAMTHNSLLIITYDEDDNDTPDNRIPTIFYGAMVKPGQYGQKINHYNVLRTVEDMFGTARVGKSKSALPAKAWKPL